MKTQVHLVASTHLDREWYASAEEFRYQTCALVNRVLGMMAKSDEFVFMLDGQTCVLDDYLEVYPEQRRTIADLIVSRRLLVGPW